MEMEKRNKMLVLNCETLEFEVKELPSNEVGYETLSEAVGGYIEHATFDKDMANRNIDMWVDEEGKLKGMKPCVAVVDERGIAVEIMVGDVVFTTCDEEGSSFGLTDEEIEFVKSKFSRAFLPLPMLMEVKRMTFNL